MKTYLVPIIQTIEFAADVRVEASSKKEAKAKALKGAFDNGGFWDWDRSEETNVKIGGWQPVEELPDE